MKKAFADDTAGLWSLYEHPIMVYKSIDSKNKWTIGYCNRYWKYGEYKKDIYHNQQYLIVGYWLINHSIQRVEYPTRAQALDAIEQAMIVEPLNWNGQGKGNNEA